jgi:hypothetical protein
MECYPGTQVSYLQTDGNRWSYGLVASPLLGGKVAAGNTVSFTGAAITGGLVAGPAATPAYGAWQVTENRAGKVTFQATTPADFQGMADGFTLLGNTEAAPGEILYRAVGNWIGSAGPAPGPVLQPSPSWLPLLLGD